MKLVVVICLVLFQCVTKTFSHYPHHHHHSRPSIKATCVLSQSATIKGTITIEQFSYFVRIRGRVTGLPKGFHGFHVHEYGDLSNGCTSFGGHYNPFKQNHGGRTSAVRHVGDLGNIFANKKEIANIHIFDRLVTLRGNIKVIGRGLVIHAKRDDLGLGGNEGSRTTGNAGARLACCVIGIAAL